MDLPRNAFKHAIRAGKQQIGLWVSLADPYCTEIVAGSGFDWILIDGEHSPNDPITVLAQLQAAAPYPVTPIVRAAWNDTVLVKRYLDVGAQSLLIPYVQTEQEAADAVAAIRYPGRGGPRPLGRHGPRGRAVRHQGRDRPHQGVRQARGHPHARRSHRAPLHRVGHDLHRRRPRRRPPRPRIRKTRREIQEISRVRYDLKSGVRYDFSCSMALSGNLLSAPTPFPL